MIIKIVTSSVQKGYWMRVYKNLNSLDSKGLEKLEKDYGVVWYGKVIKNVGMWGRGIKRDQRSLLKEVETQMLSRNMF